jgi:23S rRNA (uracil747-C5)-methyltransferase
MTVTGTLAHPVLGILGEAENLDRGYDLTHCPIHHPKLNEMLSQLPDFFRSAQLVPYHIHERTGDLKSVIAYYSPVSKEMYLRFILRSRSPTERIKRNLSALQKQFPELVCISVNLQPIAHSILAGREEIFLTDRTYIEHKIGQLSLRLSPQAFVQTNYEVANRLYTEAAQWIENLGIKKMLELYSGQGAFSFLASHRCEKILGIEINPDAVKTAQETALTLGLKHLQFKCLDATRVETEIELFSPDLILVNPPRKGLGEGVSAILKTQPQYLLYSSCAIESLAFDLDRLKSLYKIKKIQLFDMFPHTEHFEVLVLLEKY